MTDPSDIEVEPTPEERCSVAMAALSACCGGSIVSESRSHFNIAVRCSFGYAWVTCEKDLGSLAAAIYRVRDDIIARRFR